MNWYTVAKKETQGFRAGSVFKTWKDGIEQDTVWVVKQNFSYNPATGLTVGINIGNPMKYSKLYARKIFTTPVRNLEDAMEESVMQCEANYC